MSNCIFCKIVSGEIPSFKVYENDQVMAFMDISQTTKGHTLVIPKIHNENIYELESEAARDIFEVVPKIAKAIKAEFNPEGLNIISNTGEIAGQTVFHFHIHLIPRYGKGDGFGAVWKSNASDYTPEDLKGMADKIAQSIK